MQIFGNFCRKIARALAYINIFLYLCTRKGFGNEMQQPNLYIMGGHNIPEDDIRRRFNRGIYNLLHLYLPICDGVLVYNNVMTPAKLVARKRTKLDEIEIVESNMWNQLIQKI